MEKNKILIAVGFLITIVAVSVFLFMPGQTELYPESEDEIAYVKRFVPAVTVSNVSTEPVQVIDQALASGDTLNTGENGFAMVMFLDESIARVSPSSQLVIRSALNETKDLNLRTQINLAVGSLFMDVIRRGDTEFEVTTATTVASIKGTRFGMNSDNLIWVEEGEVEATVKSSGQKVSLVNKMFLQIEEDGTVESGELTDEMLAELSSEFEILDRDLIEREMRLEFRNRQGESFDENLRIFEQEQE